MHALAPESGRRCAAPRNDETIDHIAFALRSAAISLALKPNSFSTSSVCSPSSGGGAAILLGVRDSVDRLADHV